MSTSTDRATSSEEHKSQTYYANTNNLDVLNTLILHTSCWALMEESLIAALTVRLSVRSITITAYSTKQLVSYLIPTLTHL